MSDWVIQVGGYGSFLFEGNEQEAEEMRAHKSRWERAPARKRPASPEEVESGKASSCLNHSGFGFKVVFACPCMDIDCAQRAFDHLEGGSA